MLEFLGLVFLVLIGLGLLFIALIALKIFGLSRDQERVRAIQEGLDAEPIRLDAVEAPEWANEAAVTQLAASLADRGAEGCGAFTAPAAGARMLAFTLSAPPAYAVVYDHDQLAPWVDVVMRMDEGRSFTASSVHEIARGAPRPPEDAIRFFPPGTMPGVLIDAVAEQAGEVEPLAARPEEFKAFFEAAANRSQDFARTESVSQEWLEQVAEDAGVELGGDEAQQINLGRAAERYSQVQAACLKALAESGDYSAAQWEELRDSLVAVWDGMPDEYVPGVIYEFVDIPDELVDAVDDLETDEGTARERIARFNTRLPDDRQLVRVSSITAPVAADIYRGQEQYY